MSQGNYDPRYVLRGVALVGLSFAGAFLAFWVCAVAVLCFVGVGIYLAPSAVGALHALADRRRRLALAWSGVEVPALPRAEPTVATGTVSRAQKSITDRTTWREVRWAILDPFSGAIVGFVPAALVLNGLFGLAMPFVWQQRLAIWDHSWYVFIPLTSEFTAILAAVLGIVQLAVAVPLAPVLVRLNARITRGLLSRPADASHPARV